MIFPVMYAPFRIYPDPTARMSSTALIVMVCFVIFFVKRSAGYGKGRRAMMDAQRLCRSCGAGHPAFAQYCRRCGAKL
jgi:hypothetical protein